MSALVCAAHGLPLGRGLPSVYNAGSGRRLLASGPRLLNMELCRAVEFAIAVLALCCCKLMMRSAALRRAVPVVGHPAEVHPVVQLPQPPALRLRRHHGQRLPEPPRRRGRALHGAHKPSWSGVAPCRCSLGGLPSMARSFSCSTCAEHCCLRIHPRVFPKHTMPFSQAMCPPTDVRHLPC